MSQHEVRKSAAPKPLALITGASSGIGLELARIHAAHGGDLVLVARREARLNALAEELHAAHGVTAHVVAANLAQPEGPRIIYDAVQARGLVVDYLINNAGFGGLGPFHERRWAEEAEMIQVNILALCALTRLFLPEMVARGHGRILNLGSTAGTVPGPLAATYYATKAFVNSHSQALANEVRGTGVTVTVHCPGPVATEFSARAGYAHTKLFTAAVADARAVAEDAYTAMRRGRPFKVHGLMNNLLVFGSRFLPRAALAQMARRAMESRQRH